ncbi:MAG: hypothetical protein BJ554DRAFT_577 [Olpidium bornovanus]|uniref:Citrate transporter-like domain-containing protein n=1 Tax=Olpidium bornovanus TaxID=278681 RepID=A0A8H7ZU70_9FUNG|nr:MAG: hypothetical protein BJ554DRAFT_577 [Olpidium bornovanus]
MEGDSSAAVQLVATWQTVLTALAFTASLFCTVRPVYLLPAAFRGDAAAGTGRPTPRSRRHEIFARAARSVHNARLDLSTAPPLAVLLLLATTVVTPADVLRGVLGSDGIRPLDVLVLIFAFSYMSISVDLTGLYAHVALKVVNSSRGRSGRLLFGVAAFSWALGVVSGNDVVVLVMTPICVYFSRRCFFLQRSHRGGPAALSYCRVLRRKQLFDGPGHWYVLFSNERQLPLLEILLTLLSIHVVQATCKPPAFFKQFTNIIVAVSNNLNFLAYTAFFIGPAVVASITTYATIRLFFASRLSRNCLPCDASEKVNLPYPRRAFYKCCTLLACVVVLTVVNVASHGSAEIWMVAVPFATALFFADLVTDVVSGRGGRDPAARSEIAAEHEGGAGSAESAPAVTSREIALEIMENAEKIVAEPADSSATAPVSDATYSGVTETAPPDGVRQHAGPECISRASSSAAEFLPQQRPPPSSPTIASARKSPSSASFGVADAGSRFPTIGAVLSRMPWSLAPFALSMSVIVEAVHIQGWTSALARLLAPACFSVWSSVFVMGTITVLGCQLANNLPENTRRALLLPKATIFLTRVVKSAAFSVPPPAKRAALLALIYGSNVGANMMVHASLAGLMCVVGSSHFKSESAVFFFLWIFWCCFNPEDQSFFFVPPRRWIDILRQKNYRMSNWTFAKWNTAILPAALFPGLAAVAFQLTFDGFGQLLES